LDQNYQNFEIWVVNDHGVSVDWISDLDPKGRIHGLRFGSSRERSAARNVALTLSKGEYIAYLDDDDIYYPNHLDTLLQAMEAGAKIAYTDAHRIRCEIDAEGTLLEGIKDLPYSFDFDPEDIFISNCIPTLCIMHHRSLFEKAGGFDENISSHEDWDLWIRYSRLHHFIHLNKVTCAFRWESARGDSPTRMRDFQRTRKLLYTRYQNEIINNPRLEALQKKAIAQFDREIEIADLRVQGRGAPEILDRRLRGESFWAQGNIQEAFEVYREIHEILPNDPEALRRLGEIATLVGDKATAQEFFQKATALTRE
jgi:glycosyltransferase involved in cell wall biosynthesis